ncbi:aspartic peptidase domain-containing protein [Lactarius quietus]|nr:aspartic peptidase domain-containing protein [Lactarius quietus]
MRQDLHPQMLLQQHINRSHRRLARMTGREEPSVEVLMERLLTSGWPRWCYQRETRKSGAGTSCAILLLFHLLFDSLLASRTKSTSNGFSIIDLDAVANDSVTPGNSSTAPNSLSLAIDGNDVGYTAIVQIGTPPRNFSILMDSGSADFWVGGDGCLSSTTKGADCGNHLFLGEQSSTSFVDTKQPFQVAYDDVGIAGLQLNNHSFGIALTETDDFTNASFDGLMGVAQSILSEQGVPTPVQSLADNGLIQEAITSFKISRLSDQLNDGEVTFGAVDQTKFDPTTLITLSNVNKLGFWEAAMDAATVNGKDLGFKNRTAILDTGGFTVPCTTNASLALTFGGRAFTIDPKDITFVPVNANDLNGDCVSGISSGQVVAQKNG